MRHSCSVLVFLALALAQSSVHAQSLLPARFRGIRQAGAAVAGR